MDSNINSIQFLKRSCHNLVIVYENASVVLCKKTNIDFIKKNYHYINQGDINEEKFEKILQLDNPPSCIDVNSYDMISIGNISGGIKIFDSQTKKIDSFSESNTKINCLSWNDIDVKFIK